MALIVQKYGGTSVASVERIKAVAQRIAKWKHQGHDIVVVASAMSGETDRLIDLACQIQSPPKPSHLDIVVSSGEQITIGLLAMALDNIGIPSHSYCGWQLPITTDGLHGQARICSINKPKIHADLQQGYIVIIAGFQGVDANGHITTLGRGGSDTTAVALAAALAAEECQIYTDVPGVYTTDPRIAPKAKRLKTITFEEMLEMASLGSKILQLRSVEFAGKYRVKLRVLSSFEDDEDLSTLITFEKDQAMEKAMISGIAFDRNEARINITGAPNRTDIAYRILELIAQAHIEVDMIVQNSGEKGSTDFSFTLPRQHFQRSLAILQAEKTALGAIKIDGSDKVAKLSLIGMGMRSHYGIAAKMFRTLATEDIQIQMISTSEIKVSVLIEEIHLEHAVRILHTAFGLDIDHTETISALDSIQCIP